MGWFRHVSMNRRILKVLIPVAIIFSFSPDIMSQQQDFQLWPSVNIGLKVNKNLKFEFEEEVRFKENATQIDRQINDLGVGYKFGKYFRAAFYYRIEAKQKNPDVYRWRQGVYGDFSVKYDISRFTLGYRLRIHSAKVEFDDQADQWFEGFRNRHRISLAYDLKNLPLSPFAEAEAFVQITGTNSGINQYRAWLGLGWTPGKIHEFSVKYGIDQELHVYDPLTSFVISFQYAVNLSL
jgi:hypothetical protein